MLHGGEGGVLGRAVLPGDVVQRQVAHFQELMVQFAEGFRLLRELGIGGLSGYLGEELAVQRIELLQRLPGVFQQLGAGLVTLTIGLGQFAKAGAVGLYRLA
ncbi:hypothetical protein D3C80_1557110 [compost metagenome]